MSLVSQFFGGTSARKIPLKILVVGGGGGSGGVNQQPSTPGPVASASPTTSGGGGGGGLFLGNAYFIGPGTVCPITVGSGGAAGVGIGSTTATQGGNGGTSTFQDPTGETFSVIGGGGGGAGIMSPAFPTPIAPLFPTLGMGLPGGCGGGGGVNPAVPSSRGSGRGSYISISARSFIDNAPGQPNGSDSVPNYLNTSYGFYAGFPGSLPGAPIYNQGGGGTGHYGVGSPTFIGSSDLDGYYHPYLTSCNGLRSNITGILTSYGNGGGPFLYVGKTPTTPPSFNSPSGNFPSYTSEANTGNGGIGVQNTGINPLLPAPSAPGYFAGPGLAGAAGVVIVSYPSAFAASPSFPGATDISPQTPGYYTYRFTSPGSITLP